VPTSPFSRNPLKILLLEDSRFDAEFVAEFVRANYPLARLKVVADEAGFRAALRDGLGGEPFDLVLSDHDVPGYGGGEALDHVRRLAPRLPFIFVSGVIGEENAVDLLKRGATDYVSKNRLSRLPLVVDRALQEVVDREARDRAERQLRKADAIYGRVVDALHDYAVILLDRHGEIRDWNHGASAIFGLPRDEVVGTHFERLFTPEDRASGIPARELREACAHGSASDNRWMLRADGARLRADGVLTALRDTEDAAGEVTGFCKILRDGTRAFEIGEALRAAKEEAERANRAKDRFLAVLSHELRTPLAPIASAARLLEREARVPPEYAGLLPMIRRNVAYEARLIDDLLDVTAISSGNVPLQLAPVDMRALVEGVLEMMCDATAEKSIALTPHWNAANERVLGDEAHLQRVLWNVVRNAIKFTPAGGHVDLHVDNVGTLWRLRCVDDGIGITADAQEKIFSAFEQADGGVTKQFGGLGLGLAIARGLVEQHGGRLEVHSAGAGQGSTFTLTLETLAAPEVEAPAARAASPGAPACPAAGGRPIRMLLVEDNEDAADAMALSFEYLGYSVTHAPTLHRALEMARQGDYDVVLTDLGLPDGNGLELGTAVGAHMPVIALSGFGSAEDRRRTSAAGFAGHLVKPADPEDVHAVVMKALARAPA
jgi:PAS domain S-box-containing protein